MSNTPHRKLSLWICILSLCCGISCQAGLSNRKESSPAQDLSQATSSKSGRSPKVSAVDKPAELKFPDHLAELYDHLLRAQVYSLYSEGKEETQSKELLEKELAELRKAARLMPDSGYLRALVADRLLQQGNYKDALNEAQSALKKDPSVALTHLILGKIKLQEQKTDEAVQFFEKALEIDPKNREALGFLAGIYERDKADFVKANEYYLTALKFFPEQAVRLYPIIARNYFMAEQYEKAIEYYEKTLEVAPFFLAAYSQMAGAYIELKKYNEAIEIYKALLSLQRHPKGQAEVEMYLGDAYERAGKIEQAIRSYSRCVELDGDRWPVRRRLGLLNLYLGRNKEAVEQLSAYWKQFPEEWEVAQELGLAYMEMNQDEQAIALLEKVRKEGNPGPQTYVALIHLYEKQGKIEEIEKIFIEATSAGVPEIDIHMTLGFIQFEQYRNEEAVNSFTKVLRLNPESKDARIRLALLYDRLNRLEDLESIMRETLEKYPDFPEALNLLGYAYADRNINLPEAERLLLKAVELAPQAGFIIDSLGWVYYRQGRYEEALEQLKKALTLMGQPKDWVVLDHLGDTYQKLGRGSEAILHWQESLQARRSDPNKYDPNIESDIKNLEDKINAATPKSTTP